MSDWINIIGNLLILTSGTFILGLIIIPFFISLLIKFKIGKNIREEAVDGTISKLFTALHFKKSGTPTMGGLIIWLLVIIIVLFTRYLSYLGIIEESLLQRNEVYLPLFTLIFVGTLGAIDDYYNVKGIGKQKGLSFFARSSVLISFGLIGALWFYFKLDYSHVTIPFFGILDIGILYIPFFIITVFLTANAVNVTDGLDGLASGLLIIAFSVLMTLSLFRDHIFLALFCGVIIGALLSFLWYNSPPARFYMGDTGAFAFGACLAVIALMIDMSFILPFIGFVFLLEAISVGLQLIWKKIFKRKLFLIAPIHHHFEQKGISESSIVMRAWILGAVSCMFGLFIGLVILEEQNNYNIEEQSFIIT
jgi:phospho-N-acetylmuramoyl-pentapeptide-transferase